MNDFLLAVGESCREVADELRKKRDAGYDNPELISGLIYLADCLANALSRKAEKADDSHGNDIFNRDMEIERLRRANENNLEGWRQNVAGLQRQIERLRAERDALLACRHGEQRCDECPDTACSDNTVAEAAGGGSGD